MSNQDKNIDELRDLLRKKLEANVPAEDGWNVPSEGVWSGLSEELTATKRVPAANHLNRWLLAATAVLLAVFLLRECAHKGQVSQMERELKLLENSYEQLRQNCEERQSAGEKHGGEKSAPLSFGLAPNLGTQASPVAYFEEKSSDASRNKRILPKRTSLSNPSLSNALAVNNSEIENEPAQVDADIDKTSPVAISPLPTLPMDFLNSGGQVQKPSLYLPKKEEKSARLPVLAHLYAGFALTGNQLVGEKPAIIAQQKALMGWQTGLGLEVVFNRQWSLETGVRYGVHRIQTDYALSVPYTHSGEFQHDDGNYDNQYNHSLPSSLGNYPLQMVLTRESTANVEEGEVMRLDLNIRQRIQQLSMPLALRYGFGKHRWQTGIKLGLLANRTLAVEAEDHPAFVSHHGAIHQRHTSVGNPSISDLQKFTFDASLGLDIRYQVSQQLGLSLASNLQRGITPVYNGTEVKNYLQSAGIQAGLQYWFR